MGRMHIVGVLATTVIALLVLAMPASAQDVSPTQDQYVPPGPPGDTGGTDEAGFVGDPADPLDQVIAVYPGGGDGGGIGASAGSGGDGLPYTGFDLRLLLLIAAALLATGLLLRAVARSRHRWLVRRGAAGA